MLFPPSLLLISLYTEVQKLGKSTVFDRLLVSVEAATAMPLRSLDNFFALLLVDMSSVV